MVREDILGTLRTALQKGQNLQQTVQSLINAGYEKSEIDEAVKMLNTYTFQKPVFQPIKENIQTIAQQAKPQATLPGQTTQKISSYLPQNQQNFPGQNIQQQKASNYFGDPKEKASRAITIIMAIMLLILLGILVVVFLFKEQLTNFINNL